MRTTIRLDDQLLEMTKQYALSHGKTFTAIVEDALREKLMTRSPTKKQSRIKLKTVNGKGVNPGIDLDDTSSLLDVMES
ncbi:MAG: CopG family transcriptional regulator [Gammaproteobacteria bacterium]|nr:CopG family transcriptional regulator [Gammaproteobacteria bacterium]MCZ6667677.1 CopG family transcriptional regulator [Gammaproteobacteria bacterium]MCZ6723239.1 CopG family transcriptional regulator [Gammaproteobacteria bacterium]MCZ6797412.1 CopG family transcriptional regulator [Gammaproteobacteria bacterium]